jgi:hypothetical protein
MKETLNGMADPDIPRAVSSDGVDESVRYSVYGNKPAVLEIGDPVICRNPDSPTVVLKEGTHHIIRQSTTPLAVDRDLPVIPPVQAIASAKPNAAIPGHQNRTYRGIRQTLFHRNRGDRDVAKSVEAITGGDPNVTFAILKKAVNNVA